MRLGWTKRKANQVLRMYGKWGYDEVSKDIQRRCKNGFISLREAQRIVAEAEATAERIRRDTTSTVEAELAALREDLEHEVARQALTKAEALIKSQVTADRQKALVRGFIDELETHRDLSSLTA